MGQHHTPEPGRRPQFRIADARSAPSEAVRPAQTTADERARGLLSGLLDYLGRHGLLRARPSGQTGRAELPQAQAPPTGIPSARPARPGPAPPVLLYWRFESSRRPAPARDTPTQTRRTQGASGVNSNLGP
jgi:hypothetical protein